MAIFGVPPMAQTSLRALVAATWPNWKGSSTMGGKKSTVAIMAVSSLIR